MRFYFIFNYLKISKYFLKAQLFLFYFNSYFPSKFHLWFIKEILNFHLFYFLSFILFSILIPSFSILSFSVKKYTQTHIFIISPIQYKITSAQYFLFAFPFYWFCDQLSLLQILWSTVLTSVKLATRIKYLWR